MKRIGKPGAAWIILVLLLSHPAPVFGAATDSNSQEIEIPFPRPIVGQASSDIYARIYREPRPTKVYEEAVTTPQTKETKAEETMAEETPKETGPLPEETSPAMEPGDGRNPRLPSDEITYLDGIAYQDGEPLYRVDNALGQVTVYPHAMQLALEEGRDLIIQLKDGEGIVWYRIRYALEDLQEADISKIKEITFDFKQICEHLRAADKLIKSAKDEGVRLLFCRQENSGIPVYLGIRAPENWNRSYGVYQYVYDKALGEFVLSPENLSIDDDWIIETRMETMEDVVFTQSEANPFELQTWVEGMIRGNSRVDKRNAVLGTILTVLGGCTAAGFGGILTGRIVMRKR